MKKVAVFVGAQPEQRIAYNFLKETIFQNSQELDVSVYDLSDYVEESAVGRTPFSLQRFFIPALVPPTVDYAIYVDSDMAVFMSLTDLLACADCSESSIVGVRQPKGSKRGNQSSVVVFKSESLGVSLESVKKICSDYNQGSYTYNELFVDFVPLGGIEYSIPSRWNSLEHFEEGVTALLHYTDMETQPWLSSVSPLSVAWEEALKTSVSFDPKLFADHIRSGFVKPSLARFTRAAYVSELFWYPPGNIPKHRPKLWRAMRTPFLGRLVCISLRVLKAAMSRRERKVFKNLLLLILTDRRVRGERGLFDSYE